MRLDSSMKWALGIAAGAAVLLVGGIALAASGKSNSGSGGGGGGGAPGPVTQLLPNHRYMVALTAPMASTLNTVSQAQQAADSSFGQGVVTVESVGAKPLATGGTLVTIVLVYNGAQPLPLGNFLSATGIPSQVQVVVTDMGPK